MDKKEDIEGRQTKYYDNIAKTYDKHYNSVYALEYRKRVYDELLAGIDLRCCRVLDAMCGGGQQTYYFKTKVLNIQGIDISPEHCKAYKRHHPGLKITKGSILDTHFESRLFDMVTTDSLHHLHPFTDAGIREICRILAPGGLFLIWEPTTGSIFDFLRKAWYRIDPTYFLENERSIDLPDVCRKHSSVLSLKRCIYGGNIAYLLVNTSMLFRISPKIIRYYYRYCIVLEKLLGYFVKRPLSCWVAAVFEKKEK